VSHHHLLGQGLRPLTTLCRDYCGYCTFRRDPGEPGAHTMTPDEVVALAQAGGRLGAKEALFSLGDKPRRCSPRIANSSGGTATARRWPTCAPCARRC